MELFKTLNEAGTTILQVTHSEVNASYGSRIVNLRDGWIVGDWTMLPLQHPGSLVKIRLLRIQLSQENFPAAAELQLRATAAAHHHTRRLAGGTGRPPQLTLVVVHRPECPKPPLAREVGGSSPTSSHVTRTTG